MAESTGLAVQPVFIVCNARSGSTLLRYLLDSHPDIACPAETKLAQAARLLLGVNNDLAGNARVEREVKAAGAPEPTEQSLAAVRDVVTTTVSRYLGRQGKAVWCDKSLDTVQTLDVLRRLFPRARYLCLHRHAMDVVASLLESCRWGYAYFDVAPYVERRLNNVPLALAEYWTQRTNTMLQLQASSASTLEVHYEHLVRDPGTTLTTILEFLELPSDQTLVQTMIAQAFHGQHDPGAADWKIPFASVVEPTSVERGRAIPGDLIKEPVRGPMNELLGLLRYPLVGADWNVSSELGERVDRDLLNSAEPDRRVAALMAGLVARRLADYTGPALPVARLTATYGDGGRISWLLDTTTKTIQADDGRILASITVTTRAEVLLAVLVGGLPVQSAQHQDMLTIVGTADRDESRAVSRLLGALFTG
jgi:hypothetical protein